MTSLRLPCAAAALGLLGVVHADIVTITATRDNTLYEDGNALSNALGEHVFAGLNAGGISRRAVLAFDVAGSVPPGSTVTSAILELYMDRTQAGPEPVALHRLLADWGEGTSIAGGQEGGGGAATPGDATWEHTFYPSSFWASPGGDFVATGSATTTVDGVGSYSWRSPQMAVDVQAWLDDPGADFGWILVGAEPPRGAVTAKRFGSRHINQASRRPRLTLEFTTASTTGACCLGDGTCIETTMSQCATQGGAYQGDGSSCTPDPCPDPVGGCCLPDASCVVVTAADCATQGGSYQGDGTDCTGANCPVVLTPFVDPLPIPPVATPTSGTPGGVATYDIAATQFSQQLHRDLPPTTVWGYAGTYPGPTILAGVDLPVTVNWSNDLRDAQGNLLTEHALPVDLCMHGPDHEGPTPRTVVHLHGAHVPFEYDGYPEFTQLPGESVTYVYPNHQLPATLWYHDHALGITRLNVMMGLAGAYVLTDPFEQGLGLPAVTYEIPLVIQDRTFAPDGSLVYPASWQDHFFGDTVLVNGKVWPYLDVDRGKYRFRLLNGSNSRVYDLALSTGADIVVLGTDGGLLEAPIAVPNLLMLPGERYDVVIDFEPYSAGTEVLLVNSAPTPYPGSPGVGVIPDVIQFAVGASLGHTDPLPPTLRPFEAIPESEAVVERELRLRKTSEPCAGSVWLINDLGWDDITEYPELGTTEIWSFANISGVVHPMHMHLVMFQVLDRQTFDFVAGEIVPTGPRVPPPPEETGWKDTVRVNPLEITRVIARFENYDGLFAYHCHILEHEDHEMMRQFQTVSPPEALCYGDGSGTACPCGNDSPVAGRGCLHSGGLGMLIASRGTTSVSADDLLLTASQCPVGNTGIFYCGKTSFDPGAVLYDGLQCAGGDARRFQGVFQTSGVVGDTGFVAQEPSGAYFLPGETTFFQYWSRDVAAGPSPCGTSANFSPALRVTWTP